MKLVDFFTIPLDMLTIYLPSIALKLRNIFLIYIQRTSVEQNKYFRQETAFLELNIKSICNDVHTSVNDKRDAFGFPIVNFFWLSGDVPKLPSCGIYISQLVQI